MYDLQVADEQQPLNGSRVLKSKCSRSSFAVLEGLRQTGVVVGKEIRKLVKGWDVMRVR